MTLSLHHIVYGKRRKRLFVSIVNGCQETRHGKCRFVCPWHTRFSAFVLSIFKEKIPAGATLLGTVLSSDKTTISAMTGNRTAHPLLISLANIKAEYCAKSSHHAFLLLALLPVATFNTSDEDLRGVLGNRLLHDCLDFVLQPLKIAARVGKMMSDPFGNRRYCFTPLAAYIVDFPEAAMLSGVGGKTSPVTMASHKQFGDAYRHEPRTASTTLNQLRVIESVADPNNDVKAYLKVAKTFRFNGVHKLFWLDWPLAEPSLFLTPESLHHWNKEFYDHDFRWCIRMLGEQEIDFRFSVLQPRIGLRHFSTGVSRLKQVTGREHRNLQRYIIAVIAGAAPRNFVIAIRSLMDFRYLAQAPIIDDIVCDRIAAALSEFHDHKSAITDAGVRVGKANRPILNWYIPKLELMQSVVSNIKANGAAINWTADHTEHAHIEVVKDPGRSGNNQKYEEQICRDLDRSNKCRLFDLATAIRDANIEFGMPPVPSFVDNDGDSGDENDVPDNQNWTNSSSTLLNNIHSVSNIAQTRRAPTNYFEEAKCLVQDGNSNNMLQPLRTFTAGSRTAIHLNREPFMRRTLIADIASIFGIPDLAPSLARFLSCAAEGNRSIYTVGGRRPPTSGTNLPFQKLEVWSGLRIQLKDYHNPCIVSPPQTLCARPPCKEWPTGRFDAVLVNTDPDFEWPSSRISGNSLSSVIFKFLRLKTYSGHCVAQLRLVFSIVHPAGSVPPPESPTNDFLTYVQRFDIVPQAPSPRSNIGRGSFPEASTGMYVLKRSVRADGSRLGDIVPLSHIRTSVDLAPRFMAAADSRLTKEGSLEYSNEYFLNHFFDKQLYYSLLGA